MIVVAKELNCSVFDLLELELEELSFWTQAVIDYFKLKEKAQEEVSSASND